MALDKLVDSTQLDSDLGDIADAIRAKSGGSGQLAFPAGFVSEIGNIPSGGGGMTLDWATVQEVTIGANSVTNTSGVNTYFSGYNYKFIMLASDLTVNNQFVFGYSSNANGALNTPYRWRNGAIVATVVAANYDCVLVEGTKYYLIFE